MNVWWTTLFVFLGGGIGSVARFGISVGVKHYVPSLFPWGTLLVNIVGSFMIGFGMTWLSSMMKVHDSTEVTHLLLSEYMKPLLLVGVCGGFTTFSTFSLELLSFIQQDHYLFGILYILTSLFFGVAAVALGMWVAR